MNIFWFFGFVVFFASSTMAYETACKPGDPKKRCVLIPTGKDCSPCSSKAVYLSGNEYKKIMEPTVKKCHATFSKMKKDPKCKFDTARCNSAGQCVPSKLTAKEKKDLDKKIEAHRKSFENKRKK